MRCTPLLALLLVFAGSPLIEAKEEGRGGIVEGITRHEGRPAALRVEVRRLPVKAAPVPIADEESRRTQYAHWLLPGHVPGPPLASTTSDAKGRYLIEGLARGHYEVRAVDKDGLRTFAPLTIAGGRGVHVVDLGVAPGVHEVQGRIRYADGRPFTDWLIITQDAAWRTSSPWLRGADSVRPDAEGRFTVGGLLPGAAEFIAVVPDRLRVRCGDTRVPREDPLNLVVDEDLRIAEGRALHEDGTPWAGAHLIAWSARPRGGPVLARTVSDSKGLFRVHRGDGRISFRVDDSGFARGTDCDDGDTLVVRAKPAVVVGGVVRDDAGEPAAGAWIHVVPVSTGQPPQPQAVVADDRGRFRLEHVPPGTVHVLVAGGGWIAADMAQVGRTVQVEADKPLDLDLRATRARRTTGRVLDEAGQPCADVLVWPQPAANHGHWHAESLLLKTPAPAVTDAEGRYTLDTLLPDRVVDIEVRHPAWSRSPYATDARGAPGGSIEVRVQRVGRLTGRVVLAPGVGPRDVRVVAEAVTPAEMPGMKDMPAEMRAHMRRPPEQVRLLPDGSFRLTPDVPGPYRVRAAAFVGSSCRVAEALAVPGRPEPVLRLEREEPDAGWLVRVVDPKGRPVPRGYVSFRTENQFRYQTGILYIQGGRVAVFPARPAKAVSVTLYGFADTDDQPLPFASQYAASLAPGVHTIHLVPMVDLRVRVQTPDGRPVAEVHLEATPTEEGAGLGATAVTDAAGYAAFQGLQSRVVQVQIHPPTGYARAEPVRLDGDEAEVTLKIQALLRPRIVVTRADGTAVRGATVRLAPSVVAPTAFLLGVVSKTTDADGACTLPQLQPGVHIDVTIEPPNDSALRCELVAWKPKDQTVVLSTAHALAGRVFDAKARPVADGTVWIRPRGKTPPLPITGLRWQRDADGFCLAALAGADGTFSIERLPPGEYEARVGRGGRTGPTLIVSSGVTDVRLQAPTGP